MKTPGLFPWSLFGSPAALRGALVLLAACSGPSDGNDLVGDDTGDPVLDDPLAVTDVLVIGAGPAGMAAGIEIAAAGLDALILERSATHGGSARWSGALILFSGSPLQAERGVSDSPDLLLDEWAAMTGGDPDDEWVQAFAERNVVDVFEWLDGMGAHWQLAGDLHDGQSVARIHTVVATGEGGGAGEDTDLGAAFVDLLFERVTADSVLFEVDVTGLVQDDNGRVIGVTVEHQGALGDVGDGWIQAGAVVAATGGFLRDAALVSEVYPTLDLDQTWFSTGPDADGAGHRMLEDVGAVWDNAAAIDIYSHGIEDPRTPGEELLMRPLEQTLWFDADGERFVDESEYRSNRTGRAVVGRPGQLAWAVLDADTRGAVAVSDPMALPSEEGVEVPDGDGLIDAGLMVEADSIEALAAALDLDADAMSDAVADFNAAVQAGEGDAWRSDLSNVEAVDTAPFFGVRIVPTLAKAFGGIDVDTCGRVVNADGDPIPGLYAAGELTGMAGGSLVGEWGFPGSLSAVLLSARIAGESAAADVLAAE